MNFIKDQENVKIIVPTSQTSDVLIGLIAKHKPKAQSVFDYLLVATMINNNIHEIYTANSDHFKSFVSIKAINPLIED